MFRFESQSQFEEITSFTMDLLRRTRGDLSENTREIIAAHLIRKASKAVTEESLRDGCRYRVKGSGELRRNHSMPARIRKGVDVRNTENLHQPNLKDKTRGDTHGEKRRSYQDISKLSPIVEVETLERSTGWPKRNPSRECLYTSTPRKSTKFDGAGLEKNQDAVSAQALAFTKAEVGFQKEETTENGIISADEENEMHQTDVEVDIKAKSRSAFRDSINNIQRAFDRLKLHFDESRELTQRNLCDGDVIIHS